MRGERPPQYLKSALECAACLVRVVTRTRHLTVPRVCVLGEQHTRRWEERREREREGESVCYLKSGEASGKSSCVRAYSLTHRRVL